MCSARTCRCGPYRLTRHLICVGSPASTRGSRRGTRSAGCSGRRCRARPLANRWTGSQSWPAGRGEPWLEAGGRLSGRVEPALLATYETERRPAAERVIMQSRAQLALFRPGPEVTALRELFSELVTEPAVVRRLSDLLSGAENRYATGADAHPLVGRWVPDFAVTNASGTRRVAELARDGRPLLVDLTERGEVAAAVADVRRPAHRRRRTAGRRRAGGHGAARTPRRLCGLGIVVCTGLIRTNCANCVACSRIGSALVFQILLLMKASNSAV